MQTLLQIFKQLFYKFDFVGVRYIFVYIFGEFDRSFLFFFTTERIFYSLLCSRMERSRDLFIGDKLLVGRLGVDYKL